MKDKKVLVKDKGLVSLARCFLPVLVKVAENMMTDENALLCQQIL